MRISVVIPVYKVEKYIEACIKSLLDQAYRDFNIILVDDGSPDHSVAIAETLLSNQKEINYQIIRTENRGVSAARNTGLLNAQGEYVVMVDADDVLSKFFLMDFADQIREFPNRNIYSCSFSVVNESDAAFFAERTKKMECFSYQEAQIAFFNRSVKFLLPTLLLKMSFLRENGIRFDEAVRYSEDVQFIWRCLAYNRETVIHSWAKNYNYILHAGSTMTSSGIEKILTFCGGMERLEAETKNLFCEPVRSQLKTRMYFSMMHGAAQMLSFEDFKTLYDKSGSRQYIVRQTKEGSLVPRTVSLLLLLSKRLGYEITRKF